MMKISYFSCAKIIDDHELCQTQEKEKAKAMEKKEPTKIEKKKPDIMEVLKSASPVNEDLDFTFGGPAGMFSSFGRRLINYCQQKKETCN